MFNQASSHQELEAVAVELNKRNFSTEIVASKAAALAKLKEILPEGAQVMTGSSTTLDQIGFTDYLASAESKLVSVHEQVNQENDKIKRNTLRRQAVAADYFLASPNAVTKDGIIVSVDQTGSRIGAMPFAAGQLILVVGAQKITANLDEAMRRIREYVFPLEDKRALAAYGSHTSFGKWVILENEVNPARVKVILVEEALGF
jgi:hypothetical protein